LGARLGLALYFLLPRRCGRSQRWSDRPAQLGRLRQFARRSLRRRAGGRVLISARRLRTAIAVTVSIAIPPRTRIPPPGLGLGIEHPSPLLLLQNLAAIDPRLDPDHTVGRVGFRETVIDVGPQRVQRKLALQVPLTARDFGAVQSARNSHLDALAAET